MCEGVGMGEGEGEGEKEEPSEAKMIRWLNMHLHQPFILQAVLLQAVCSVTDGWIGPFPVSCSSLTTLLVSFSVGCAFGGVSAPLESWVSCAFSLVWRKDRKNMSIVKNIYHIYRMHS